MHGKDDQSNLLEHGRRHWGASHHGRLGGELPGPLALLLLVDEVAARAVGAVAGDPVLLAVLGLVLVVPPHVVLELRNQ